MITSAARPIWAEPDETVYVVPSTVKVPLVRESMYPCESFPVTVKVRVPDAVPFLVGVTPTVLKVPWVLVMVMVWPAVMLTAEYWPPGPPGPPPWLGIPEKGR